MVKYSVALILWERMLIPEFTKDRKPRPFRGMII
jgi:hypothetical protein